MNLTPFQLSQLDVVTRAWLFAQHAHRNQLRKYTHQPYIAHPENVARIVGLVTDDPTMLAAAWLHDTVEDCGVSLHHIEDTFNIGVAMLVDELTDKTRPEDGNREMRKAMDRARVSRVSDEAQTVKLADMIDNTMSIVAHDPAFARTYLGEKRALLHVLTRGNNKLWKIADRLVTALVELV